MAIEDRAIGAWYQTGRPVERIAKIPIAGAVRPGRTHGERRSHQQHDHAGPGTDTAEEAEAVQRGHGDGGFVMVMNEFAELDD